MKYLIAWGDKNNGSSFTFDSEKKIHDAGSALTRAKELAERQPDKIVYILQMYQAIEMVLTAKVTMTAMKE